MFDGVPHLCISESLTYSGRAAAVLAADPQAARWSGQVVSSGQPGGCLTQWHVHTTLCLSGVLDVVGAVGPARPTCPPGSVNRATHPMMHIWFVPIPGGPTAIDAPNRLIVSAAEQVAAPANGPSISSSGTR